MRRSGVPFLVAVGELDFAREQAYAFAEEVKRAGGFVRLDERPALEHLLIVREAAPAAFQFFADHGLVAGKRFH